MSSSRLFEPIKVGTQTLSHRVVLAPLTRYRATAKTHVPVTSLVGKYYSQRSSRPGSLLVTEATFIDARAGGYDNIPGIWSQEQIAAWKEITDSVHANKSFIYLQLWALGRAATSSVLESEGLPFVSASPIALDPKSGTPRELTESEIQEYVQLYAQAAKNAIKAGFDGVEVHGANGYLVDQFIQDVTNQRTDRYGGSVENRSRFGLEVVQAVVKTVGEERTGIRLSPWGTYQGMRMANPIPQYTHFVTQLKDAHPKLAYLHVVEPEAAHSAHKEGEAPESNDFIRKIWAPRPLITASGYTRDTALERAKTNDNELIAFGKDYISNPDLPTRIEKNIPLNVYDFATFYAPGDKEGADKGYVDYPFADQSLQIRAPQEVKA